MVQAVGIIMIDQISAVEIVRSLRVKSQQNNERRLSLQSFRAVFSGSSLVKSYNDKMEQPSTIKSYILSFWAHSCLQHSRSVDLPVESATNLDRQNRRLRSLAISNRNLICSRIGSSALRWKCVEITSVNCQLECINSKNWRAPWPLLRHDKCQRFVSQRSILASHPSRTIAGFFAHKATKWQLRGLVYHINMRYNTCVSSTCPWSVDLESGTACVSPHSSGKSRRKALYAISPQTPCSETENSWKWSRERKRERERDRREMEREMERWRERERDGEIERERDGEGDGERKREREREREAETWITLCLRSPRSLLRSARGPFLTWILPWDPPPPTKTTQWNLLNLGNSLKMKGRPMDANPSAPYKGQKTTKPGQGGSRAKTPPCPTTPAKGILSRKIHLKEYGDFGSECPLVWGCETSGFFRCRYPLSWFCGLWPLRR